MGSGRSYLPEVALCAILLAGCTTPSSTDPAISAPMRFKNWWNYYEQGLSYLEAGNPTEARTCFEIAMGIRPGPKPGHNDRDRWREITYGVHTIEFYFPNRELGVALYRLGKFEEARTYLERSLEMTPSGRAKYYLNRVQEQLLASATIAPPTIQFDAPGDVTWTRDPDVTVSGVARGAGHIAGLDIEEAAQFIELADQVCAFSKPMRLQSGTNTIDVVARDLLNQESSDSHTWVLDRLPPQFTVRQTTQPGGHQEIVLSCSDNHALRRVTTFGEVQYEAQTGEVTRRRRVHVSVPPGVTHIPVQVVDLAGNVRDMLLASPPQPAESASSFQQKYASSAPVVPPPESRAKRRDRKVPICWLSGDDRPLIVYRDEIFVDGRVEDKGGLAGIWVDGEAYLDEEDIGSEEAYFSFFAQHLKEGENVFEVEVEDMEGNAVTNQVRVTYQEPEIKDARYRLRLAVPPSVSEDSDLERYAVEGLQYYVAQTAHRSAARFIVAERNREQLERMMEELTLSMTDLVREDAKLEVGKMITAELLLASGMKADEEGLTILGKVVETDDGRVICYDDVYASDPTNDRELDRQIKGLMLKIERRFPLCEGVVSRRDQNMAFLNVGSRDGVRAGTLFVAIPPASNYVGRLRRYGSNRIELQAELVLENTCEAEILPSEGQQELKAGDRVLAR